MGMVNLNNDDQKKLVTDLETCIGWFESLEGPSQEQKKQAAQWYNFRGLIRDDKCRAISATAYTAYLSKP